MKTLKRETAQTQTRTDRKAFSARANKSFHNQIKKRAQLVETLTQTQTQTLISAISPVSVVTSRPCCTITSKLSSSSSLLLSWHCPCASRSTHTHTHYMSALIIHSFLHSASQDFRAFWSCCCWCWCCSLHCHWAVVTAVAHLGTNHRNRNQLTFDGGLNDSLVCLVCSGVVVFVAEALLPLRF